MITPPIECAVPSRAFPDRIGGDGRGYIRRSSRQMASCLARRTEGFNTEVTENHGGSRRTGITRHDIASNANGSTLPEAAEPGPPCTSVVLRALRGKNLEALKQRRRMGCEARRFIGRYSQQIRWWPSRRGKNFTTEFTEDHGSSPRPGISHHFAELRTNGLLTRTSANPGAPRTSAILRALRVKNLETCNQDRPMGIDITQLIGRCSHQIPWRLPPPDKNLTTEFTKNHGVPRSPGTDHQPRADGLITHASAPSIPPCTSVVLGVLRGKNLVALNEHRRMIPQTPAKP
jgi:hypothetical protein